MEEIKSQEGFQEDFLSSSADIVIGGGAAGVGKTFAMLLEALRYVDTVGFGAVMFRRTSPQIRSEGGLWDTSMKLYPLVGGQPRESTLDWVFGKHKAKIKFSHLEYEKNVLDWQGSQIPLIAFDELTHFTEHMFFYLLSRNRSVCGIKPYVRATCNPDPDSWVSDFIEWWIEQEPQSPNYGFPIVERCGKLRYFIKDGNSIVWGESKEDVIDKTEHIIDKIIEASPETDPYSLIKSVTFIPGSIYQNKKLLGEDPGYLGNLMAQDENTKSRLLDGNWKVKNDGSALISLEKLKNSFTNTFVDRGKMAITADIALKGSDLLVIFVWEGWRVIDSKIMEISKGDTVVDEIKKLALRYHVPNGNIVYDDDGAGSFIDGFIKNSKPFKNGARPVNKENYKNRKTQMFYRLADRINHDGLYISEEVANKIVKRKKISEHIIKERGAIKRDKIDMDGKLCIIPKDQMKNIIGHSPDFMDTLMMREYLECFIESTKPVSKSSLGLH